MEIIIGIAAFLFSCLTFFSGFGLGTLLMPVLALFFPIPIAIAITAIVHVLNNILKFTLILKHVDWSVVLKYGIVSILAAWFGALGLQYVSEHQFIIYNYSFLSKTFSITLLKVIVGFIILFFTWFENKKQKKINAQQVYIISLLSGFLGGLSGNQGALRAIFLNTLKLSKESFIATGAAIAIGIDITRIGKYSQLFLNSTNINYNIIIIATTSAFVGTYFGTKYLKKINHSTTNKITHYFLISIALLLISGII